MNFNQRRSGKSLFGGPSLSGSHTPGGAAGVFTPAFSTNNRQRLTARTVQGSAGPPKRSFDGRPSTVNLRPPQSATGRTSSFYGAGGRAVPKDTRNLMDKHTQNQMKIRLIEALTQLQFPQLSEKMLKQPTKMDFIRIFEHIFKSVGDPDYKCQLKIEDEIPKLFRDLGYPFALKASTMQTISAGHSWPHVLGALVWLVDLIGFQNRIDIVHMLYASEDDFSTQNLICQKQILYGYYKRCFQLRLEEDEEEIDFEELNTRLERELMDGQSEAGEAGMGQLERNQASLLEELEELKAAPHQELILEDEISRLRKDMPKMEEFNTELTNFEQGLTNQIRVAIQNRETTEAERDSVQEEILGKKEVIGQQKLSANQIRQFRFAKREAQKQLEVLAEEKKRKSQEQWSLETALSRSTEGMKQSYRIFSQGIRLLISKVQPEGADWDSMVDWEISPLSPKFSFFCTETLKKNTRWLVSYCNQDVHRAKKDILELNQTEEELNERLLSNREEAEDLMAKAETLNKETEEYKLVRANENQGMKQELQRKRERLAQENRVKNMSFEEKQAEHDRLEQELKTEKKQLDAELSKLIKDVLTCSAKTAEHKKKVTEMQAEVNAKIERVRAAMAGKTNKQSQ